MKSKEWHSVTHQSSTAAGGKSILIRLRRLLLRIFSYLVCWRRIGFIYYFFFVVARLAYLQSGILRHLLVAVPEDSNRDNLVDNFFWQAFFKSLTRSVR